MRSKYTRRQGMKAGVVSLLAVFGIKIKTASGFDPSCIMYRKIHPAILGNYWMIPTKWITPTKSIQSQTIRGSKCLNV